MTIQTLKNKKNVNLEWKKKFKLGIGEMAK